jgi:hypothetical protein
MSNDESPVKSGKYEKDKKTTKNKGKRLDRGGLFTDILPCF